MQNEYLYHHGVKGMKWGVRKKPPTNPELKKLNKERKQAKKASKKATREFYMHGLKYPISQYTTRKKESDRLSFEMMSKDMDLFIKKYDYKKAKKQSKGNTKVNVKKENKRLNIERGKKYVDMILLQYGNTNTYQNILDGRSRVSE